MRPSLLAIFLSILCLVLTPLLSILAALFGASLAGVKSGGIGWQYLYALYGGGMLGLLGGIASYWIAWSKIKDAVSSFAVTVLLVPTLLFVVSLGFHLIAIRLQ